MFKCVNLLCLVRSYRDRIQGKLLINILIIALLGKILVGEAEISGRTGEGRD